MQIVFVFVSPYKGGDKEFDGHLIKHGDGVKDVAFEVEDLESIVQVRRPTTKATLFGKVFLFRELKRRKRKSSVISGRRATSMASSDSPPFKQ